MQKRKSAGHRLSAIAPTTDAPAIARRRDHDGTAVQAPVPAPAERAGALSRRAFLALALAGALASQVPIADGPRQVRFSKAAMEKALNRVIADNNAFAAGMHRSRAIYREGSAEHLAQQTILDECGYPRHLG